MFRSFLIVFIINVITSINQFVNSQPFFVDVDTNTSNVRKANKFMLIPSIGYEIENEPGKFILSFTGWYYEPLDFGSLVYLIKQTLITIFDNLDKKEKLTKSMEDERLVPFFVRDVQNHEIKLILNEERSYSITTDTNGRFDERIAIDSLEELNIQNEVLKYIATDSKTNDTSYEGVIYLMRHNRHVGCSIISDVDDTIKISEVPQNKKLLINTFKREFISVPGMSDIYRMWQSSYGCLIHYVSAMPSQLYYATQKFLDREKFPSGSFHMRHLQLVNSDKTQLFKNIFNFIGSSASQVHKLTVIRTILDSSPVTQQFILVGDSGEFDPEIYGEITREYSDRIQDIFIRVVEGGENDMKRFQKAFINISTDRWKLFTNAKELSAKFYHEFVPQATNFSNTNTSVQMLWYINIIIGYYLLSVTS